MRRTGDARTKAGACGCRSACRTAIPTPRVASARRLHDAPGLQRRGTASSATASSSAPDDRGLLDRPLARPSGRSGGEQRELYRHRNAERRVHGSRGAQRGGLAHRRLRVVRTDLALSHVVDIELVDARRDDERDHAAGQLHAHDHGHERKPDAHDVGRPAREEEVKGTGALTEEDRGLPRHQPKDRGDAYPASPQQAGGP